MLYFGRWEWHDDGRRQHWRAPGGAAVGVIDLRTLPQQATQGGNGGAGLFAYPAAQVHADLLIDLGESIDSRSLTSLEKGAILDALGMPSDTPISTNARRAIQQCLVEPDFTDPTGQARPKPFRANLRTKGVRASIGSAVIFRERVTDEHPALIACGDVFRADYVRHRQVLGTPERTLRRWTGHQMRAMYGRMTDSDARILLPEAYRGDGWERPQTTITESFNKADGALGPDLSWTVFDGSGLEVRSNQFTYIDGLGSFGGARADSPVGSDDHYVQALFGASWTGGSVGVLCRKDNTATKTLYQWAHFQWNDHWELAKFVSGAETILDSAYTADPAAGHSLKLAADGSSVSVYHQGSLHTTVTDTGVTGNLYCGANGGDFGGVALVPSLDSFEASDGLYTQTRRGGAAYYRTGRRIVPL